MRSQRRAGVTVALVKTTNPDTDKYGDDPGTTPPEPVQIDGAIFEPLQILERASSDQAPVVRPAAWNLPGVYEIDADDVIVDGDTRWLVTGGGVVWLDRTKVPVTEPRKL